jgi:hypothetical protein
MKTKIVKCECSSMGQCLEKLMLMKSKKDSHVKIRIHKTTVRIGIYQLYRIYEWFGKAITETK